jgi:hypothetical protein
LGFLKKRWVFWPKNDLDKTGAIPEVTKNDAPVVATAMNPPADRGRLAYVVFTQISAVNRSFHLDGGLYNTDLLMKFMVFMALFISVTLLRAEEAAIMAPETGIEREDSTAALESESRGIIPVGGVRFSTRPTTPISFIPEKKPREQAREGLALAKDLLSKGKFEAASDVSLQAYDDFMSLSLPRRNKKGRQELRLERRQAATVYIDSSIAYIKEFVKRGSGNTDVIEEGRQRLATLRDVAVNYPELMKKLNSAIASFTSSQS